MPARAITLGTVLLLMSCASCADQLLGCQYTPLVNAVPTGTDCSAIQSCELYITIVLALYVNALFHAVGVLNSTSMLLILMVLPGVNVAFMVLVVIP